MTRNGSPSFSPRTSPCANAIRAGDAWSGGICSQSVKVCDQNVVFHASFSRSRSPCRRHGGIAPLGVARTIRLPSAAARSTIASSTVKS